VWNVIFGQQSAAWRCIATWSCAVHFLGQQQCTTFAQSTRARAWVAHGARKICRRKRPYSTTLKQLPPRLVRVVLVSLSHHMIIFVIWLVICVLPTERSSNCHILSLEVREHSLFAIGQGSPHGMNFLWEAARRDNCGFWVCWALRLAADHVFRSEVCLAHELSGARFVSRRIPLVVRGSTSAEVCNSCWVALLHFFWV